jgi:hypothetical protein
MGSSTPKNKIVTTFKQTMEHADMSCSHSSSLRSFGLLPSHSTCTTNSHGTHGQKKKGAGRVRKALVAAHSPDAKAEQEALKQYDEKADATGGW